MNPQKIRMPVDITMTVLSIILMGGTILFTDDRVHQILGMVLLLLWGLHVFLNRKWYGSLFRGSYNPFRIFQTAVNLGLLFCAFLLMLSGMSMAWFMPASFALSFARTAHLISSHWYYVLMSLHLGLHVDMIFRKIKAGREKRGLSSRKQPVFLGLSLKILLCLACLNGAGAFVARGVWKYMFLLQQFFFFDFGKGYIRFAMDYISIIVLFAFVAHFLQKNLKKRTSSFGKD